MFTQWAVKPGAPQYLWALAVLGDFLVIGGALFFVLRLVPSRARKMVVVAVTFLAGLIYSVEFFVPPDPKTGENFLTVFAQQRVADITLVLSSFALGLGIFSLLRFHGRNLARRRAGWHNSLALYVAFAAMLGAGFWQMFSKSPAAKNTYDMLFGGTVAAPGATMFSIIAFYIVSAAYRAFRIRSAEATLMLAAAFVVMLGVVPIGQYLTSGLPEAGFWSNLRMENVTYWILKEPNMAAWRAISFGVEIGALAMALRTLLSLERGSFFEREL